MVCDRPRGRRLLSSAVAALLVGSLQSAVPAAAQEPPPLPEVSADGAVLWDVADDRVLGGTDETTPRRPASTTKLLTVWLALQEAQPDDTVTVSQHAVDVGATPGAATLNLSAGQEIQLRSVLAGLMLQSGNDGAVAVAEHVSGSEDAFVDLMNERAAELGLTETHFINATGLTDDLDHHASPLDLARLADVALDEPELAHWARSQQLDVAGLGVVSSRNELLGSYEGATGVKTGFTAAAGMCLVASAERDGLRLIAVVLGSTDSFGDAAALLDHGFATYRRVEPTRAGHMVTTYRWSHDEVPVTAASTLGATVAKDARARWRASLMPEVALPLAAGDPLGEAELIVDGEVVDTAALVADDDVEAAPETGGTAGAGGAVADALRAFARVPQAARAVRPP